MNWAFSFDILKLALYIGCAYAAFAIYVRYAQNSRMKVLAGKRLTVLTLLTLLIVGVKIFEDVLSKESGPVDTAVLWFVKHRVGPGMLDFFGAVTWTGAAIALVPATTLITLGLLATHHRREAFLLVISMASGWAFTYVLKALVNRPRPALWSTSWYWGSSFPSGHTLSTAAFSTALAICAIRIWPSSRVLVLLIGILWTFLMGLSRLVLGVHWPTDVLAAVCVGVFISLSISSMMDIYSNNKLPHENFSGVKPPA